MDRGESNHSADTGQAKYEPSLDTSHDSGILRQTQGNHDLLVRGGHDHDQVSNILRFPSSLVQPHLQLRKNDSPIRILSPLIFCLAHRMTIFLSHANSASKLF